MSSIHFFIAPENITASPTNFFGPISSNEYRTTTHFTSANDAKAFAICKGHVLITPQIDAGGAEVENVVNVVLKPAEQPLQGLPIKYIIYRGLQLSSFFDDGKVIQTGADLINKVQADFISLYGNSGEVIFTADQLGYFSVGATGWEGSKKLSSAFFKVTDSSEPPEQAYELPLVQAGESIGLFIDDTCGIDVVLDYGDYELPASELAFDFNMDFARKATNSIDLANVSGGAFAQKVTREQIFQFIDVAAIYGAAQQQGLSVSSIDAQGNLRTETGDNIFSLITSKFTTKNNWYIYIQSDRQRSYNFYGNYTIGSTTNNLYYGAAANTLAAYSYGTQGWPLLILNAAQNHSNSSYKLYVKLLTDNNKSTRLYVGCGGYDNAEKNNFGTAKTLVNDPTHADYEAGLTQTIELSTAATGSNGSKQPVCSVLSMVYNGKAYSINLGEQPSIPTIDNITKGKPLDEIWYLINYQQVQTETNNSDIKADLNTKLQVTQQVIDNSSEITYSHNKYRCKDQLIDFNGLPVERVTMGLIPTNLFSDENFVSRGGSKLAPLSVVSGSTSSLVDSPLPILFEYSLERIVLESDNLNVIKLITVDGAIPNTQIIGLDKNEYDSLIEESESSGLINSSVYLVKVLESNEAIAGKKYTIFLCAAIGESVTNELMLVYPTDPIKVYTFDDEIYFTKKYSDYLNNSTYNISDVTISAEV